MNERKHLDLMAIKGPPPEGLRYAEDGTLVVNDSPSWILLQFPD